MMTFNTKNNFRNLIIKYYITKGPKYIRLNKEPFYIIISNNENNFFNIEIIKRFLIKDKIDKSKLINYRYYDENKKAFIKINEFKKYPILEKRLFLELNFDDNNNYLYEFKNLYFNLKEKIRKIKEKRNYSKNNKEEYDLIYLYASPLLNEGNVEQTPINYRLEINNLINLLNKKKKKYNCIFECVNEKIFKNYLSKKIKILHIASHGDLYIPSQNDLKKNIKNFFYKLILEDKGVKQEIDEIKLEKIFKNLQNKLKLIDLVFVSTCYSENIGKLFYEYGAKNVIYIKGMTPISDLAALKFSEYFYEELIEGHTIKKSFYNTQNKIKLNRKIIYMNPNNCCCNHKHMNNCKIKKDNNIHKEYHIKICDCKFDEYNIHKKNCELIKKIEKDKIEDKVTKLNYKNNNYKICCCNLEIPHNESSKFVLESRLDCAPLSNQISGKLKINENWIFDFDNNKNFSIIGREKEMKEIYDIINSNNEHIIIICGDKEIGKNDFAESVSNYLFERKIINSYYNIEIRGKEELIEKILKISKYDKYKNGKIIIIIKINYSLPKNKSNELLSNILNILDEISIIYNNYYFIILFLCENEIDVKVNAKVKCKIFHLNKLKIESANKLLENLCESIDYRKNFEKLKESNIAELLQLVKYKRKDIYYLAELICEEPNFEKIKSIINFSLYIKAKEKIKFEELKDNELFKIYYLLSIVPFGLPNNIINLIYPNLYLNLKYIKNDLIYISNEDQFYHINEKYKKDIYEYFNNKTKEKTECFYNLIKVYAKLLYYYIEKNKKIINFSDSNIHYIFNSYNCEGIWKTFDESLYEFCFLHEIDNNRYNNILENDFIINSFKNNIINLIENNLDYIKDLLMINNNLFLKEYLEQILIMLPSSYFFNKNCKNIIYKCIYLSENLGLSNSKKRLLLFLYSLEEKPEIKPEEFNLIGREFEGEAEAYFLNGLKYKKKDEFVNAIKNYSKINNSNGEIKKKIGLANYEISILFFMDKKYKEAEQYLEKAKIFFEEINDKFLIYRCKIDLIMISLKVSKNYNECISLLNNIINNCENSYIKKEAYQLKIKLNKNIEPDIFILNSNPLNNNFSVINSGIFAYLNNQYYLLQKIYEKVKSNIKIKSIVLNKNNLEESLSKEGKILIIQSDDFSKKGEIILESDIGQSQILSIDEDVENKSTFNLLLPEKIKFKIVILCFINSSKLIDKFKDKVEYLISFDEINSFDLDDDALLKYNELSIDFLIDFIEKTTKNNIKESFEYSKAQFISKLNEYKDLKINNFIALTKQIDNGKNIENIEYENNIYKDGKGEKIFLYYPFPDLPFNNLRNKDYTDEIFYLIQQILSQKQDLINVYLNIDKIKK